MCSTVIFLLDRYHWEFRESLCMYVERGGGKFGVLVLCSVYHSFLQDKVPAYADQSFQYFSLLCFLLKKMQAEIPLSNSEARLTKEIEWLKSARVCGEEESQL